ncbi:MAG: glycine zipper 2TM domain-containing protein [Gemmatimonadota bacterium]
MLRKSLAVMGILAAVACSNRDRTDQAAADSLSRDLQMSPADSSAMLNDQPTTPMATTTPPATTPRQTTPRPSSGNTATNSSTGTSTAGSVAAGTMIQANTTSQITSRNNKAGETLTATVASDVSDSRGRVIIPAGSTVKMTISQIQPAENKSAQDGKIVLMPSTIEVGGKSYTLNASIESVEHTLQGRGVTTGDAAKVGVGAAAGAIAGRVISGNKSGAIIGGVVGAAVGTGVAMETADRDVVVPAGARVVLKLTEPLTL